MLGIYVRTSIDDEMRESPIEQQKKLGIQFAIEKGFPYEIYEDKGISGFKTADDDDDPLKNRPRFIDLINDIKKKKIESVWVWENSRLSRNRLASATIFHIFERHNIKLFEKDIEFDLKDPQTKMFRGMLDLMAEYERSLIIARTTRGLHNKINQGKRSFGCLYGYKKAGVDSKGYQFLVKVESEQENLKYGYKRILEGASLRQLTMELYNNNLIDKNESMRVSRYWHKLLHHFSYTGFELNIEGLKILKSFDKFEIDDISTLTDEQYYTKSLNYPDQLISIENWIKVATKLRANRKIRSQKMNKASKDMATGIITCSDCGQKYYSFTHACKKNGNTYFYQYYKHFILMNKLHDCGQKKSFTVGNIDNIFKLFYFYYYMVFDNTVELLEESKRLIMTNQMKLKEQIKHFEDNEKQYERLIKKFNSVLDESDDTNEIRIIAKRITETEEKVKTNFDDLARAKIELEQLNQQYAGTEAVNTFYNVKDRVNEFFENNVEGQRDSLITAIKNCYIFSPYMVIDTGKMLFIFDTEAKYEFDKDTLLGLEKEKIYKENFIQSFTDDKVIIDIGDIGKEQNIKEKIYKANEMAISEFKLTGQNKRFNTQIVERLFEKMNIKYDFSNHVNVLFFMELD